MAQNNSNDRPSYDVDDVGNQPKHVLDDPEFFAKNRTILGNLITKNMNVTGGTDIDCLIEHNDHFIIIEIKNFHDDLLVFPKGQMISFEKIYTKLGDCDFFFIGHDGIDFKNPSDKVWIFEMRNWLNSIRAKCIFNQNYKKYFINKLLMNEIDVKILRDIIDASWTN